MIALPTTTGKVEISEVAGACVIDGCKVKGGGLISVQNTTTDPESLSTLAWEGRVITLCAAHFLFALTNAVRLVE